MSMRPLVLWYLPVSDVGGVLRHASDVAQTGMDRHRLVFVVPPGPAVTLLRGAGAPVISAPVGVDDGPVKATRALSRITRTLRPAVVHSHLAFADVVLAAAALPRGTHRITTEHGIAAQHDLYHSGAVRQALTPRLHAARLTRFNAAIAVSHATAHEMRRQWRAHLPIHVLHNGVDAAPRTPSIGRRILVLSRLAPEKRIDSLLRAFARLRSDDARWTVTVGGEGELRQDLHSLARELGVDEAVSFPGFIDARSALREHDVLVQLSDWENCSYSLLDAVAAGVGVVASDVGGNSEFLPPQSLTTGTETEVARLIEEQALSPDRRPHLPLGWPSIANMIDHIETVYEELQS